MEHFFEIYGRMVDDGWLDKILIGKLDGGETYYCAIYADRMGISPYRFAKADTAGGAFRFAFNSIVCMDAYLNNRKPTDDII